MPEKATNSRRQLGGHFRLNRSNVSTSLYRAVVVQLSSIRLTFPTCSIGMLIARTDLQLATVPFVTGIFRKIRCKETIFRTDRFVSAFGWSGLEWNDTGKRHDVYLEETCSPSFEHSISSNAITSRGTFSETSGSHTESTHAFVS